MPGMTPVLAGAILQGFAICGEAGGRLGRRTFGMLQSVAVRDLQITAPPARAVAPCSVKTGILCPVCRGALARLGRMAPQYRCEACGRHFAKISSPDDEALSV